MNFEEVVAGYWEDHSRVSEEDGIGKELEEGE